MDDVEKGGTDSKGAEGQADAEGRIDRIVQDFRD